MTIFGKSLPDIDEDDLLALISNKTEERKTLDYKLKLPTNSDKDKKDFLADVSSFANTGGGYLIYGMVEKNGTATQLPGLDGIDPDGEILRLEQMIREGIAPRLTSSTKPLQLQNGNFALIIHIPQSYNSPHMVTYQGASRFYARQSNGKYQLDVQQLRQAFSFSATVAERIRDFRLERIARIGSDETPVPLGQGKAKLVVHAIPVVSFSTSFLFDVAGISKTYNQYFGQRFDCRFNIDGIVLYESSDEKQVKTYYQIFRNGCIEFVYTRLSYTDIGGLALRSLKAEEEIIKSVASSLIFQKVNVIQPPTIIFVSLLGVKGMIFGLPQSHWNISSSCFDRDTILIPEVMLDNYPDDNNPTYLMKPALDAMWNAGGFPGSESFDKSGKWYRPFQ
jgi:hypothetical protein